MRWKPSRPCRPSWRRPVERARYWTPLGPCRLSDLRTGACVEVIESAAKSDVGGRAPEIKLFDTIPGAPGT